MKPSKLFLITSALLLFLEGCSTKSNEVANQSHKLPEASADDTLAEVERLIKDSKLDKVKDNFTICSINDVPLTMGEYKRQLNAQMRQFQNQLAVNPQIRVDVLQQSQRKGVSLTPAEKKEMLDRAHTLSKSGSNSFNKMLKDNKISQSDFDKEVLEMGLACKTAKVVIQDSLLNQLINRVLLSSAAKASGLSKQALNKLSEEKRTPRYQQMLKTSGLSPETIEQELIKNDLSALMINKLQSEASVSDSDVRKFYEENRSRMRHGARIKLSQILIEAPTEDQGTILSLKTQVRKSHPDMSDVEVENQVNDTVKKQHQKAESILTRALSSGVDFAELANQNTEDVSARTAKNGGDLGYQEEGRLPKEFVARLTNVKPGEVAPEIIRTPVGFHIIKLTAREPAGIISYDEAKEQIKAFLTQQKSREAVQKWLDTERHAARVTLSPDTQALSASIAKENKEKSVRTP